MFKRKDPNRKQFYFTRHLVKESFAHKKIEAAHRYLKSEVYVCINNR